MNNTESNMSHKKVSNQHIPSAHGNVKVTVYTYGSKAYARDTHADVFADDDLPEVHTPQFEHCPGCGTRKRTVNSCRMFDCTHNPNATSAPLDADLESDRFTGQKTEEQIQHDVAALHPSEMERLICDTLFLLASNGCREINAEQCIWLRKLFGLMPGIPRTITARASTFSFEFEEDDGTACINVTLPMTPGTPGTLNVHRPRRHVDASGEFSQLEEIEIALDEEHDDIIYAHATAAQMIEQARAIKGVA
jgi:hypothetical protein